MLWGAQSLLHRLNRASDFTKTKPEEIPFLWAMRRLPGPSHCLRQGLPFPSLLNLLGAPATSQSIVVHLTFVICLTGSSVMLTLWAGILRLMKRQVCLRTTLFVFPALYGADVPVCVCPPHGFCSSVSFISLVWPRWVIANTPSDSLADIESPSPSSAFIITVSFWRFFFSAHSFSKDYFVTIIQERVLRL